MTLLLFDLDDTLLGNEMNDFIPVYLQALSTRLSSVADPTVLVPALLAATRQMVDNTSPDHTLEQVFDTAFFPALGLLRQDVQGLIDAFYAEDFPRLEVFTRHLPEAVQVVKQLIDRGDQAAVATNPLFPLTAIQQRLQWAGLPTGEVPFVLVPSYETFHFAKPNPAYFAELLAQLGWPKGPVVMVGNDVDSDISAARQLDISVFWINRNGTSAWSGQGDVPPCGDISELISWLNTASPHPVPTSFNAPVALLAILRSTPAALSTLSRQQVPVLDQSPAPGEWSPAEVLCHLRDVDTEVNLVRLQKVIKTRNPFIAGLDTDPWAEERQYCFQDGLQALADFTSARLELLALLEELPPDAWDRPARHAYFGPTHLRELVNIIVGHDILHVQQVYKALHSKL